MRKMRIRYKRKRRKTRRMYGQKYRGYGQVGRHRHHPGGKGMAGAKDHMKIYLMKKGYIFGTGKGFVRHGVRREFAEYNIGQLLEMATKGEIAARWEDDKLTIDMSAIRYVKVLGRGNVSVPIRLVLHEKAKISAKAREKIESAGGEIIIKRGSQTEALPS